VARQKSGDVEHSNTVETIDEDQWRLETSWGGEAEEGGKAAGSESRCEGNEVVCRLRIRSTIRNLNLEGHAGRRR